MVTFYHWHSKALLGVSPWLEHVGSAFAKNRCIYTSGNLGSKVLTFILRFGKVGGFVKVPQVPGGFSFQDGYLGDDWWLGTFITMPTWLGHKLLPKLQTPAVPPRSCSRPPDEWGPLSKKVTQTDSWCYAIHPKFLHHHFWLVYSRSFLMTCGFSSPSNIWSFLLLSMPHYSCDFGGIDSAVHC